MLDNFRTLFIFCINVDIEELLLFNKNKGLYITLSRNCHQMDTWINCSDSALIVKISGHSWGHLKPSYDRRWSFSGSGSNFVSGGKILHAKELPKDLSCWFRVSIMPFVRPLWGHRVKKSVIFVFTLCDNRYHWAVFATWRQYEGNKKLPDCLKKATRLCEALAMLSCCHHSIIRLHKLRQLTCGDNYPSVSYSFRVAKHHLPHHQWSMWCHQSRACCWGDPLSYYNWRVDCHCWAVWGKIEISTLVHYVALIGKYVAVTCPGNTGSVHKNYKGFFSIVLMALVEADYTFLWIDVGSDDSSNDASISNGSELKEGPGESEQHIQSPWWGVYLVIKFLSHTT